MGRREVGGLANLLGAHRDVANPAHRAEVAALWGVPEVPAVPGKSAVEMFQAAADGEIKALWIVSTNPAQSMRHQTLVRRALKRAEFVVLQETYANTATADFVDLVLPASSWGEKSGTVTSSERRASRVRAAIAAPGQARDDRGALARSGLTLVIYMGVARLAEVVAALHGGGLCGDTPAAVISSAHTSTQRQAVCTLASLVETVAREGLTSPAIVVVGEVVQASPLWALAATGARHDRKRSLQRQALATV